MTVRLTDGGVYDNLGINPLVVRGQVAVGYLISSDGGMPFKFKSNPTRSSVKTLKTALSIYKDQVVRHQTRNAKGGGRTALWFAIDSPFDGNEEETVKIGTNLKALSARQVEVLTQHGENLVNQRICRVAPELIRDKVQRRASCPFVNALVVFLEGKKGGAASSNEIALGMAMPRQVKKDGTTKIDRKVEYLLARLAVDGQVMSGPEGYFVAQPLAPEVRVAAVCPAHPFGWRVVRTGRCNL